MVMNSCYSFFLQNEGGEFYCLSYLAFLFYRILLADESSEEVKD